MIVGSRVKAKSRMLVDDDGEGTERYAEAGEEGVVTLLNTSSEDGRFINYGIEFPRTGAYGFYDVAEVQANFEILGGRRTIRVPMDGGPSIEVEISEAEYQRITAARGGREW